MSNQLDSSQAPLQPVAQNSTLAIVSLVLGIVGWVILPIVGAIGAIITGHLAKKEIRESAGRLIGDGLATAGLVLGYLQVVFIAIPVCIIVILALLGPAIGDVFSNIMLSL